MYEIRRSLLSILRSKTFTTNAFARLRNFVSFVLNFGSFLSLDRCIRKSFGFISARVFAYGELVTIVRQFPHEFVIVYSCFWSRVKRHPNKINDKTKLSTVVDCEIDDCRQGLMVFHFLKAHRHRHPKLSGLTGRNSVFRTTINGPQAPRVLLNTRLVNGLSTYY